MDYFTSILVSVESQIDNAIGLTVVPEPSKNKKEGIEEDNDNNDSGSDRRESSYNGSDRRENSDRKENDKNDKIISILADNNYTNYNNTMDSIKVELTSNDNTISNDLYTSSLLTSSLDSQTLSNAVSYFGDFITSTTNTLTNNNAINNHMVYNDDITSDNLAINKEITNEIISEDNDYDELKDLVIESSKKIDEEPLLFDNVIESYNLSQTIDKNFKDNISIEDNQINNTYINNDNLLNLKQIEDLKIENQKLKSQILNLDSSSKLSLKNLTNENEELIKKLNLLQENLKKIEKEKNKLKAESLKNNDSNDAIQELIKAKDDQMAAVMAEGESWAKKLHTVEANYKKSRSLVTERDAEITILKEEIKVLQMDEISKNLQAQIDSINLEKSEFEVTIQSLKKSTTTLNEENNDLKSQLAKLSCDESNRNSVFQNFQESQMNFSRLIVESQAKEELFLNTISELRSKYSVLESKQEVILHSIPSATQPLLRQIESLQSNLKFKTNSWTTQESILNGQISELIFKLEKSLEENNSISEIQNAKIVILNKELDSLSTIIIELKKDLEIKSELLDSLKLSDIKNKKIINELTASLENENALNERISNLTLKLDLIQKEYKHEKLLKQNLEAELVHMKSSNYIYELQSDNKRTSVNDLGDISKNEIEIVILKDLINTLEGTKSSLSSQIINLTNNNFQLNNELNKMFVIQEKYKDLCSRYDAAVDVIAEKSQLIVDLNSDLEEVKEVFKLQLKSLLPDTQIDSLI